MMWFVVVVRSSRLRCWSGCRMRCGAGRITITNAFGIICAQQWRCLKNDVAPLVPMMCRSRMEHLERRQSYQALLPAGTAAQCTCAFCRTAFSSLHYFQLSHTATGCKHCYQMSLSLASRFGPWSLRLDQTLVYRGWPEAQLHATTSLLS
jgi:hypothetical protein